DVGGRRGGGVEGVVGGVGPADRDPAHGDRLAAGDVLVGESGRGVRVGEDVAADPVVAQRDCGRRAAVVDLVDAVGRHRQGARGDVGGGRGGGVGQGVVGGVRTADRYAAHADGVAVGDVLVGKGGSGVAVGEDVTRDPVVGEGHRGRGGAVVDLVHPGSRDGERPRGDVGAGQCGGVEGVVAGVGPADGDPGDRDCLADADVLVIEGGSGEAAGEDVTRDPVVGERHRGRGSAVVDPIQP